MPQIEHVLSLKQRLSEYEQKYSQRQIEFSYIERLHSRIIAFRDSCNEEQIAFFENSCLEIIVSSFSEKHKIFILISALYDRNVEMNEIILSVLSKLNPKIVMTEFISELYNLELFAGQIIHRFFQNIVSSHDQIDLFDSIYKSSFPSTQEKIVELSKKSIRFFENQCLKDNPAFRIKQLFVHK